MVLFYRRQIEVTVAGLTISEPRISVELERSLDRTQDRGRVDIYNLSPGHEQRIYERGGPIQLQAGYPDTLATIFEGEVQRVLRARERLARITRIHVGDQVRQKVRLSGVTNRSYDGAEPVRQIVRDLASDMGLPVGPLDAIPSGATYTNFYWGGQSTAAAMDVILASVKCGWFERDGVIRINRLGMTQADAPTIMLSPKLGLIDSPIVTDEGSEVRMFLRPEVVLGCVLNLESETLSGGWKVVGMRHEADNWRGRFETWCDLRSMG